jgi:hypothetical protein
MRCVSSTVNDSQCSGAGARKFFEKLGCERANVFQSICPGAEQCDRDFEFRQILLSCEFPIDGNKHIKFFFD